MERQTMKDEDSELSSLLGEIGKADEGSAEKKTNSIRRKKGVNLHFERLPIQVTTEKITVDSFLLQWDACKRTVLISSPVQFFVGQQVFLLISNGANKGNLRGKVTECQRRENPRAILTANPHPYFLTILV
jgi:hypothetical protein